VPSGRRSTCRSSCRRPARVIVAHQSWPRRARREHALRLHASHAFTPAAMVSAWSSSGAYAAFCSPRYSRAMAAIPTASGAASFSTPKASAAKPAPMVAGARTGKCASHPNSVSTLIATAARSGWCAPRRSERERSAAAKMRKACKSRRTHRLCLCVLTRRGGGDPNGNRTHVTGVRGRCPNR
jgi:hypothetical protein